jgi:hypothetical protein
MTVLESMPLPHFSIKAGAYCVVSRVPAQANRRLRLVDPLAVHRDDEWLWSRTA